jgi:hypothetical protein
MRRRTIGWVAAILTAGFAASCSSSDNGASDCIPAPGSCDAPPPQMSLLNQQSGCLAAPTALTAVCDTSVSRCNASAGLGPVCAFAPDAGIFVAIMSDNDMLTAVGWHFSQPVMSFPNPEAIPPAQWATAAEADDCARAVCAPSCPGAETRPSEFCALDGGHAGGG